MLRGTVNIACFVGRRSLKFHASVQNWFRNHLRLCGIVTVAVTVVSFGYEAPLRAQEFKTKKANIVVETLADNLSHPWGIAFLPDGRMLVTERVGRLRLLDPDAPKGKRLSKPIKGVPKVAARRQGGLLDVALDPDFKNNRLIYLSYSEPRQGNRSATAVARGRLNKAETVLLSTQVIFRQQPPAKGGAHFGSRLVFARDGALFITTGDRYHLRDEAQDPSNHLGKVIRINRNGSLRTDNPNAEGKSWAPEIWSIGHRNAQGAAIHPETGELWTVEHGARGGDEINIPRKGRNYGWPVITYGRDYSGAKIGVSTHKEGMEQPVYYWDPSVAPSGMVFYTGEKFPNWAGNLFVGALAGMSLIRLELEGERVQIEERMLEGLDARIRDVRQGPDGYLYLLNDSDGRVLRLLPSNK